MKINALDYAEIKRNFIEYLKNDPKSTFSDIDYAASGINSLLNILSYNTHYNAIYSKMLLNEAFIDSAVLKESLMSKAKLVQYVPQSKKSATAEISLEVLAFSENVAGYKPEPLSRNIIIPKGTTFVSTNSKTDNRVFCTLDNVIIRNRVISNEVVSPLHPNLKMVVYTSSPFMINEGSLTSWDFIVDNSIIAPRYIIKDANIDIDTLKVSVNNLIYTRTNNSIGVKSTDLVYYLTTNEQGFYEIYFGENVYGVSPPHGSTIHTEFLSTNGESGNGARVFALSNTDSNSDVGFIGFFDKIKVITNSSSSMGSNEETLESLRFNIPNNFKTQNRLHNKWDYRNIIMQKFRNIDSINVWGGEENYYKDYGKVYISIKPKGANAITEQVKNILQQSIFKPYGAVGSDVVFSDPEFIEIDLSVYVNIDKKNNLLGFGEISSNIQTKITDYNTNYLNKFENYYSDYRLIEYIINNVSNLSSVYTKKTIQKSYNFYIVNQIEHVIHIGNAIRSGTIKSTPFLWKGDEWIYRDTNGLLECVNLKTSDVWKNTGTIDYTNGLLKFQFPQFARSLTDFTATTSTLEFGCEPLNPDIYSYQNNIVRIRNIGVSIV